MPVDQTRLLRSAGRSPVVLAWVMLIGLATWSVFLIPAVSQVLHSSPRDVGFAVAAVVVAHTLVMLCYHRVGETNALYAAFALGDQCVKHGALMWLVYRSGGADSFFWLVYVVVGVVNALIPEYRRILGSLFIAFPLFLAGAFAASGGWANAGLTLITTGLGGLAFYVCSYVSVQYAALMSEREKLARELADLRVRDDRIRIARDLHDGIGADLAALAWKARRIQAELGDSALSDQLNGMTERASQSIDDLRSIVWALRERSQTWEELVAYVRQRCHELCAERAQLDVQDLSEGEQRALPGDLCLHVVRSAQEAVRNALRHGNARHIQMRLQLDGGIVLTMEDDGTGIAPDKLNRNTGGLANMRSRAESMGGSLSVEHLSPGTRLTMKLSAPVSHSSTQPAPGHEKAPLALRERGLR